MRVVLHADIPEDETLRCQWNELVQRMERPEVFYTYEWARAVHVAYQSSLTPLLFLAYEHDSLVGVAALATDSVQQEVRFLAGTTADYCDFVSLPERRHGLVDAILAELRNLKAPTLALANLPADSVTARALAASAEALGHNVFARPAYQCSQVSLSGPDQRQAVRRSLRHKRSLRYLKNVPVTVDHLRSWDQIAPLLPQFSRLHVARFSAVNRTSFLASPERCVFLSELARLLSRQGWLTLSQLQLREQPVAWQYGFQFCRHWFFYQAAFDSNFSEYSPGFALLVKSIEAACESSEVDCVDLGLGDEGYKQRLATGTRQTLHVTVAHSVMTCMRVAARYHAATAIKSSPRLENVVRRLVGRPAETAQP